MKLSKLPFRKMPLNYKKFDVRNAVYLTDHDNNGNKISEIEFYSRIREIEDFFVNLFGGHTRAALGKGEFKTLKGKIIEENTVKIESFTDRKTFQKNSEKLKNWLLKKKLEWKQEYIGYEFQGNLFYL